MPIGTERVEDIFRPGEAELSRRIFTDPEVHRRELDQIFTRSWLFVAHESEIPSPGDYVVRQTGNDPVIVARREDGGISVLLNACTHRGMRVCRVDRGNSSHFRCPYHGWTYSNEGRLIGVAMRREVYGNDFDPSRFKLVEPPHVDTAFGLIFVCWESEAPSLDEYLGDMKWYLQLLFGRTDQGMEVIGAPQRHRAHFNWKLNCENIAGDGYHTPYTHRHALELGLFKGGTNKGHTIHTEHGHTVRIQNFPEEAPLPKYFGWPDELMPGVDRTLSPEQKEAISNVTVVHGLVFPNFSFVEGLLMGTGDESLPPVSFLNFRMMHPIAPDLTEHWSWIVVPRGSPDWWKEASRLAFVRIHGVSGTFDQDDLEMMTNITAANKGAVASRYTFNYEIGLDSEPDPTWPGPGIAYARDVNEANQRAFYRRWSEYMADGRGNGASGHGDGAAKVEA